MMKLAEGELIYVVWYLEYDEETGQYTPHYAPRVTDGNWVNAKIITRTDGVFMGYWVYMVWLDGVDHPVFVTEQSRKMTPYHMTRYGDSWFPLGAEHDLLTLDQEYWNKFKEFDAEERLRWAEWNDVEPASDDYEFVAGVGEKFLKIRDEEVRKNQRA